jgi:hypothetical protein
MEDVGHDTRSYRRPASSTDEPRAREVRYAGLELSILLK